jgi:hypothetical protein
VIVSSLTYPSCIPTKLVLLVPVETGALRYRRI